eukprot:1152030-Pelagomonas_calceolata.AAC.19
MAKSLSLAAHGCCPQWAFQRPHPSSPLCQLSSHSGNPLHRKAYLNHRYHARRGLYLAAVAAHLRSTKAFRSRRMRWEACQQDPSRPVLVLSPPPPSQSSSPSKPAAPHLFELRLMPCLPPSTFPLVKLAPDRNAVRTVQHAQPVAGPRETAAQQQQHLSKEREQEAALLPTPTYNTSVVADCCALLHAALLQCALQANPKLADGLLLLKVGILCTCLC